METPESIIINNYLKSLAVTPSNDSMFRLSWSDDQFELRKGTYCLYMGEVFIKEEKRTERVHKYNWIRERWILEKWTPPDQIKEKDELPEWQKGSYECFYVFETKKGGPLPLRLDVVQFIMKHMLRPNSSPSRIKSAINDEIERKEGLIATLDDDYLRDIISSPIMSNIHFGEGSIVPANYNILPPNLRGKTK